MGLLIGPGIGCHGLWVRNPGRGVGSVVPHTIVSPLFGHSCVGASRSTFGAVALCCCRGARFSATDAYPSAQ